MDKRCEDHDLPAEGEIIKADEGELIQPLDAECCSNQVDSLRFEEKEYTQGWALTDEPMGRNAKAPEYFKDLFCNLGCYEEYRLRTSNRSIHQAVGVHRKSSTKDCKSEELVCQSEVDKLVSDPSEGNAWHADHIVPVYRGGGECRLENTGTLCVACPADVTAAQCVEQRAMRMKAKKKLKAIVSDIRNAENIERNSSCGKDEGPSEIKEDILEDELLVNVPESAYSLVAKSSSPGTEELKNSPKHE
ncbi:hypothetical protein PTKIN_Ptkin04bG0061800 [Pterospermum kingtungense]